MSAVIVPVLLRGLCDRLPNVRLSAARVADDILSVAAISSWPPPGGRSGTAVRQGGGCAQGGGGGGGGDAGEGDMAESSPDVLLPLASSPRVVDGDGDGDGDGGDGGGVDNFVVVNAEPELESRGRGGGSSGGGAGDGGGSASGGEWWGCGWEEVERRLELVSASDPDRDASYFATQALKPKWMGDSPRRV